MEHSRASGTAFGKQGTQWPPVILTQGDELDCSVKRFLSVCHARDERLLVINTSAPSGLGEGQNVRTLPSGGHVLSLQLELASLRKGLC